MKAHTWESVLGPLLRAPDPAAARAALLDDPDLPPDVRAAVEACDPTGLRVLGLLVASLRFNRLLQRSPEQAQRYHADPETWARQFQAWHAENPADPETETGPG